MIFRPLAHAVRMQADGETSRRGEMPYSFAMSHGFQQQI
jgi:hypothetical protein